MSTIYLGIVIHYTKYVVKININYRTWNC